jgi:hypothetical protein
MVSHKVRGRDHLGNYRWRKISHENGSWWHKVYNVRFEAFTAVTMKNAVIWDVALCNLQPPAHTGSSLANFLYPEDGGDAFLRNVG